MELLAFFEAEEWRSVMEPSRLQELQDYARAAMAQGQPVASTSFASDAPTPTR